MNEKPNTPMMKQYFEIKEQYPDCVLFYRLGDFYEMFFDDAVFASKELEIALTGRDCGMQERAPMCGVPFHSADLYINKLISRGYKVAICEQVEESSLAKGLVKREVIKVITAGTNTNADTLQSDKPNYLMSLFRRNNCFGIACTDILTGDFFVDELDSLSDLYDKITAYDPSEIIVSDEIFNSGFDKKHRAVADTNITVLDGIYFDEKGAVDALLSQQKASSLHELNLENLKVAQVSAGAVVLYLRHTQKSDDFKLGQIRDIKKSEYMIIDDFSRKNLELLESLSTKQKKGSLLNILDKTMTAMGGRRLREFILNPLYSIDRIIKRQSIIEELINNKVALSLIRADLSKIYDCDRIMGKIVYSNANPKDLLKLKSSLEYFPKIKDHFLRLKNAPYLSEMLNNIDILEDAYEIIDSSIRNDADDSIKDGNIIKQGFDETIDKLRDAYIDGKKWISNLEAKERQRTGIKSLKIKNNRVFGYLIEVTNTYQDSVPSDFIRRQTMTNAQRYTTEELNEMSELILGSQDKLLTLEYEKFLEIRHKISEFSERLRNTTQILSSLDAYSSLAFVAIANDYTKPDINNEGRVFIKNGRHPVVEGMLSGNSFIANDTFLDTDKNMISVITGPNMAGKSTYMRQVALIVLMAHIGSFVPADDCDISLTDRIFTRVGASDDLASGKSTFMVEMTEVAHILKNATKDSLLILDEIGRGTGTIDGLSIAWSVIEYISNREKIGAKTLFATHYHELSRLEGRLDGVRNYSVSVKEDGDEIVFLRKIVKGGANKSYGIQVAGLAGVPKEVIDRANELLLELGENDLMDKIKHIDVDKQVKETFSEDDKTPNIFQMSKKQADTILKLESLNLDNMTPMEAMNALFNLRKGLQE